MSECTHPQGFDYDSLCYTCGADSSDVVANLQQQLAALREALDTGVNRFYLYEGDPAYETMKAALQGSSEEGG